jgi:hypothetical protein
MLSARVCIVYVQVGTRPIRDGLDAVLRHCSFLAPAVRNWTNGIDP